MAKRSWRSKSAKGWPNRLENDEETATDTSEASGLSTRAKRGNIRGNLSEQASHSPRGPAQSASEKQHLDRPASTGNADNIARGTNRPSKGRRDGKPERGSLGGRPAFTDGIQLSRDQSGSDGTAKRVPSGAHADPNTADQGSEDNRRKGRSFRGKGKGRKTRTAAGQSKLRGMRPPVTPSPDVVFAPPKNTNKDLATSFETAEMPRGRIVGHKNNVRPKLYAALDLGTNNCRLLVAQPQTRGKFRVVDGFSRIVRLGEGLSRTGMLSDEAMDRALGALKLCAEKIAAHDLQGFRLIATEACRQASNGMQFLDRVQSDTGLRLEIINRQTEAYLAAEGCASLLDRKSDSVVLFDIGGGSSELVLIDKRQRKKRIADQIVSWASLPMGVVTLAERHGGQHVTHESFEQMVSDVIGELESFPGRNRLKAIWGKGRSHLLGTSGTVTTLAGLHLKLPRYDRRQVDGLWMRSKDVDRVVADLLGMDFSERTASPCIGSERADLVLAGCAILEAIRRVWPSERLRVADRGLREGILTQLMERDRAWAPPKRGRWPRVRNRDNSPGNPAK